MANGVPPALYVVTNDHVARKAGAVRIADPDGRHPADVIETPQDEWLRHPDGDDVAVFPLGIVQPETFFYSAISPGNFMHAVDGKSWLGPGEDVFLLGRHIGSDGLNVDTPMARFGHIAAPPVKIRNRHRGGIEQLSYLVEILSRSGYSGSPVIVFRLQLETPYMGGVRIGIGEPRDRPLKAQFGTSGSPTLLGINWGHIDQPSAVLVPGDDSEYTDPVAHPDRSFVLHNSGLAAVVPAWKISDLLWSDELEEMRAEQLAAHRRRSDADR